MEFFIIILLLLLNGFFALYEIALVSANRVRITSLAEGGSHGAKRVLKQIQNPEQTLSTIQIGITLIGIVSGAFGGMALADNLEPLMARIPGAAPYAERLAVVVTIALITYLSLIIGELVPKAIALSRPERYAMLLSGPITVLTWVCFPFVWILSLSTRFVNHLLGVKGAETQAMTEEELKLMLQQSSEQGVIGSHEKEMLYDVFKFSDRHIKELMTPRHEMVVMHVSDSKEKVVETIERHNYSKYLLVGDNRDEVVGVVSVKDIVHLLNSPDQPFDLTRVAKPALLLPETIYAKKAVELFKTNKTKFGVVVDEYGGTEGIVTLHDLTESIFGDIVEGNETHAPEIVRRYDGSWLVDASINLDDFMEEMQIKQYDDIDSQGFNTLGGLAMYVLRKLPKTGDRFTYQDLQLEIVDMDGERIDKILVYKDHKPHHHEDTLTD